MLIDWFTVGAQVLNFLILVWLMKRFLYKPILNAIDAREKHIASELADADVKRAEAQKERDDFQGKNKAFDEQRSDLFSKAEADATAERERLIDEARKAGDTVRAIQAAALRTDQVRLGREITRLAKEEVFAIARKTLADLATVSLEERIGEVFTRRLHEMDGEATGIFGEALKTSCEPALLRSTFGMPSAQRAAIQNALNETFSAEVQVRFETAPDDVCGIELTANGQKIAWSIADYLTSLDQKVSELMDTQPQPTPKPKAASDVKLRNGSAPAVSSEVYAGVK